MLTNDWCITRYYGKVQVSNDQEKAQSERNSHSKYRGGKTKLAIRYLYLEFPNILSYFPIGGHSVTRTSNGTEIRLQNIKQMEPQQKHCLGTIYKITGEVGGGGA